MQWKHACSSRSHKFKVHASAGKVMCTVFWDAEGMYTGDWLYATQSDDLLRKLCIAIKENHRGKLTHVPLLLHYSAPVHSYHVGQAAVLECGFEEMRHKPYSPDLADSDYHLFPNLKKKPPSMDIDFQPMMQVCMQPKSGWKGQSKPSHFTGI